MRRVSIPGILGVIILSASMISAPTSATSAESDDPMVVETDTPRLEPDPRLRDASDAASASGSADTSERAVPDLGAVDAADVISLSGTIAYLDPDGHPGPSAGATTVVELHAPDRHELVGTSSGSTFSFTGLWGGQDYFLVARDASGRYATTYAGDTPYDGQATRYSDSTVDIVITMPTASSVSGKASFSETPAGDAVVEAWRADPATPELTCLQVAFVDPDTGVYSMSLSPGDYVLRIRIANGDANQAAQYFDHADSLGDSVTIDLAPGDALSDIDFDMKTFQWFVHRVDGANRYETSVNSTQLSFGPGVPVLYLASGENWPDALSAGPAASKQAGALLLSDPRGLLPVVEAEIRRLQPKRVIIAGGPASMSDALLAQVKAIVPDTTRIGGADRYATSRALIADAFPVGAYHSIFLATGMNFPDALSAAPIAGRRGEPLLLLNTAQGYLDEATRDSIERIAPARGFYVGGPAVMPRYLMDELERSGLVGEVWGAVGQDRYETSEQLNIWYGAHPLNDVVFLAQGDGFADALSGATVAAAVGAPLRLSRPGCIPSSTRKVMNWNNESQVVLLGGRAALGDRVAGIESC
ncbi:putative cell wall-binding protein [Agromyces sp. 3263]|uniref:cell wall-binding repeat-containing protein n=1 Tax=Agromyces sp. 3263 TaxID=2817750 RepID=UPI0028661E46|nr:cell wall-binding repeat-containing protein [Agromyces sp. 3263]MDR6906290.1 putative cell wall-binding protein [Agromyces sp. 3263]